MIYTGNCLCGQVHFKLVHTIDTLVFCHCSQCRKQSGSAFNSGIRVHKKDLEVIKGEALIAEYSTPEGMHRYFCSNCGSPLFSCKDHIPDQYTVRAGAINEDFTPVSKKHIYVGSMALWDEINDDYPQFDTI